MKTKNNGAKTNDNDTFNPLDIRTNAMGKQMKNTHGKLAPENSDYITGTDIPKNIHQWMYESQLNENTKLQEANERLQKQVTELQTLVFSLQDKIRKAGI